MSRVGSLQLTLPVLTPIGAVLVLGEAISVAIAIAAVVVVAGTAIAHAGVARD